MITCTDKAADYFQMPESFLNLFYKNYLVTLFCGSCDKDRSGGLSYDEFRYTFGLFADRTSFGLWAFDHDRNGFFDEDKAEAWDMILARWEDNGRVLNWEISDEQRACLESAKYNAKDIF